MKDIHNHPLFTDITPEEEVSVQGGLAWWQNVVIGRGLTIINPWLGLAWSGYNALNSLYEYNKRTAPYRDSNGRLIAS